MTPPAIYDHDYRGPLRVLQGSLQELEDTCHLGFGIITSMTALGCSWWAGDVCIVVLPIVGGQITPALRYAVWKHERAHCLGWPKDHPR